MSFNQKYNKDSSIIRSAIVGLINQLNNTINFENQWDNEKIQVVKVPFFYAMSGDERFLQDNFSNWSDCYPNFIEGNVDPIPRGTIFLPSGASILSNNLTSRYVRGSYVKEVDGQMLEYNSLINSIPLQLNFTAEIIADTSLDTMKIVESIISNFYRSIVFNINYKGFRIPTEAGFPDNYNVQKQFEFTYGTEDERLKVTFDIEVQTYLPLIDKNEERFAGNTMQSIGGTLGLTGNDLKDSFTVTVDFGEKK